MAELKTGRLSYVEAAFRIGNEHPLVAVTTVPAGRGAAGEKPWVVLLNAGIIHRVGPNRLYVELARRLAGAGYPVIRFDLGGIGDSDPPAPTLSSWESALADVGRVLDWLQQTRGAGRFILAGLCAGANHAIGRAAADARVCAVVLLDPAIPRTVRQRRREFVRKAFRRRDFASLMGIVRRLPNRGDTDPRGISADDPQARAALEGLYRAAVDRGVAFYVICTNDRPFLVNYREQLLDAFPSVRFGDQLTLEFDAESDHTFEDEQCRARLIESIADWCQQAASVERQVDGHVAGTYRSDKAQDGRAP